MVLSHRERHRTERVGWLRATVLGANYCILSTASLVLVSQRRMRRTAMYCSRELPAWSRGAMSMAAGEYVSVHSQADTEQADLALERKELKIDDLGERRELTAIYVDRGLDPALAKQVADQLMTHDAIGAHARDELGISDTLSARPIQAALASAGSFAVGAAMPLLTVVLAPETGLIAVASATSLYSSLFWAVAARAGGARIMVGACASRCGGRWPWD